MTLTSRLISEGLGTAFLLATVVGSGIMAESLTSDIGLALLANSIATGAVLYVLIVTFGPVSGAHFNPAVTLAMRIRNELSWKESGLYILVQIMGGVLGVLAAHAMFAQDLVQLTGASRTGAPLWFSETIATFGLVFFILAALKSRPTAVAPVVALYITAAYWFTASTSFANPAVTLARALTASFSGIDPTHVPAFILMQCLGAVLAVGVANLIWTRDLSAD